MAYTLNRGIDNGGLDRVQRGLLVGLAAIAIILSFGAIWHQHSANNQSNSAKTIPIVSSLTTAGGSNTGTGASSAGDNGTAANTSAPVAGSSNLNSAATVSPIPTSSGPAAAYSGGSGGLVGGRGGGPTGGGTTGSSGGSVSIPQCSIGQIATVTCQVPACSPAVTLSAGQKAILGVGGTCIIVN